MSGIMLAFVGSGGGPVVGQQAYLTAGTYSWVAPAGVTSISMVAVGGGANACYVCCTPFPGPGGGGGALAYRNNVTVTPGSSYTVVAGAGGYTAIGSTVNVTGIVVSAGPGVNTGAGGTVVVGSGGSGGTSTGGGGGAGGYAGAGGNSTLNGSGGGGGGGASGPGITDGGGGGVGLLGQGASGVGASGSGQQRGQGGSGGLPLTSDANGAGGLYGGGGGSIFPGAGGAVRIIWPGTTRSFPSTCTGNL